MQHMFVKIKSDMNKVGKDKIYLNWSEKISEYISSEKLWLLINVWHIWLPFSLGYNVDIVEDCSWW